MQLTRRALLGMAAVGAAGCQSRTNPTPPAAAVPDAAALQTARRMEQALLMAYDAKIRRTPPHHRGALQVERAIHTAHLRALPVSAAPQTATPRRVAASRSALLASARRLRQLALHASDGRNAALLASIAASHTASAG